MVFFQSRLNVKVQVYFSPHYYVHVIAKLFMHAFAHLCLFRLWLLCGGEKTGDSNFFFYSFCGTLIWVGIVRVIVDRILTGIIRIYIILGELVEKVHVISSNLSLKFVKPNGLIFSAFQIYMSVLYKMKVMNGVYTFKSSHFCDVFAERQKPASENSKRVKSE